MGMHTLWRIRGPVESKQPESDEVVDHEDDHAGNQRAQQQREVGRIHDFRDVSRANYVLHPSSCRKCQ